MWCAEHREINTTMSSSDEEDSFTVCSKCTFLCNCEKCARCSAPLELPYIQCSECEDLCLCAKCYAKGAEVLTHRSDHRYRVVRYDFSLFDGSAWTAAEELVMLDVLMKYGYGSWDQCTKVLPERTQQEIKTHYDTFYIEKPALASLPRVPISSQSIYRPPIILYNCRTADVEEPPRYAQNTIGYDSIAGYIAGRSDFEVEYDDSAEFLLSELRNTTFTKDHPQYNILTDLQYSIGLIYNRRIRERARRKRIVRDHGMILLRKTMSWMHRYEKTITRPVLERLMKFIQVTTGEEFDRFVEGLHHAAELKEKIGRLCEYRKLGITTLQGASVYEDLKAQREKHQRDLENFCSLPQFNWKKYILPEMGVSVPNKRVQYRPLDIIGMPGCEKLLPKEQELCKSARLVPMSYIELRDLLIAECKKTGSIKLAAARKILKIDVNKTRKLYDFLVQEGYIVKP